MVKYKDLYTRIRDVSKRLPDKTAISCGGNNISYFQLERITNRISNLLHEKVGAMNNIVVFSDYIPIVVEAMVGIIKSNCIFVPVDPEFPDNRVKVIINEVDCRWMVSQVKWLARVDRIAEQAGQKINVLILENVEESVINAYRNINILTCKHTPVTCQFSIETVNKHCYIYFTSGSTGKPKGILGRRRSLSHFIEWEIREFGVDETMNISQFTPPAFDPFLRDTFVALCSGATLHIPERKDIILNSVKIVDWLNSNRITLVHMVPSLFKVLAEGISSPNCLKTLKYILLAGEMLRGNDIKNFVDTFDEKIGLVNLYGPTETTLAKFFYRIKKEDSLKSVIPVGKPISSTEALLLDKDMHRCQIGSIGEIYIRTPYISSGYYKNRELTKTVFIKNPFNDNPQDILYRTGDTGRILADQNIELLGRSDHQVKIRGYRIEPGEIENRILKHKLIKQAVVLGREDKKNNKYLCAYLVSDEKPGISQLRSFLGRELPEYMIPSCFMQVESMPMLANGKIDRKALPAPDLNILPGQEFEAPVNEVEGALQRIWQQVLAVEKIGTNHNFFELGGHSIKALNITSGIYKEMGIELALSEIIKQPTIKELAQFIVGDKKNVYSMIHTVPEREFYPVSSAQKRMFSLSRLEGVGTSYNTVRMMEIEGKLDKPLLEETFRKIVDRHEILRTAFTVVDNEPVQIIYKNVDYKILYMEANEDGVDDMVKWFIKPFKLDQPPLFRIGLISLPRDKYLLLVDIHHIITDGTSKGILMQEFMDLYNGKELLPLAIQYKDFAVWQNELIRTSVMKEQEEYWLAVYSGKVPVLNLPLDYCRPKNQSFRGDKLVFNIDSPLTDELSRLAQEENTTLYMTLLAAYFILLSKYSGQEDIVVGSPITGRSNPGLEKLMGMFVNTLAVRSYPCGKKIFRDFLKEVKEKTLKAFENQEYQFDMLVEKLNLKRTDGRNPLFDTMFAWQNMNIPEIAISDMKFKHYEFESNITHFDILLQGFDDDNTIRFILEYCTMLFKKETMERMICHFINILKTIVRDSRIKISDMDILGDEEKRQVIYTFNKERRQGDYDF